ncbi:unnamed protein product [Brassicogethes aeneus]|uniref:Uncharacterized protein n=1 Tax=Brassicogethes aeneus TaxID=1431903 RepID=A0A9P0BKT4_BRAAE|nr:unnamed protein product [Brassicogethes aeneus]
MSKTFLKPFYINLLQCCIQLEITVTENLENITTRLREGDYDIEKAKDYHYKEILKKLKNIKSQVDSIRENEAELDHLNSIDVLNEAERKRYSYVQEKVKVFSRSECNLNTLHLRESRRASMMASQNSLNAWEQILETNKEKPADVFLKPPVRNKSICRKNKKFISETFDNFLEEKPDLETLNSIPETDTLTVPDGVDENRRSLIENEEAIAQCIEDYLSNNNILEPIEHEKKFVSPTIEDENRKSLIEHEKVIAQCNEGYLSNNKILEPIEHNAHTPKIVGFLRIPFIHVYIALSYLQIKTSLISKTIINKVFVNNTTIFIVCITSKMGGSSSKSQLKRNNTLRRTQRKSLYKVGDKIEALKKNVNKFKGVEEDDAYEDLHRALHQIRREYARRGRDLQNELHSTYKNIGKIIDEVELVLNNKIELNRDEIANKPRRRKSRVREEDVTSQINTVVSGGYTTDEELEAEQLKKATKKRNTVELKVVRVVPDKEILSSVFSSPDSQRRKSILKMGGVNVTPNAMKNELEKRKSVNIVLEKDLEYQDNKSINEQEQLDNLIEKLRNIELNINKFNDTQNSHEYRKLRDHLMICQSDLHELELNEEGYTKWNDAKNYCTSCINFLEQRANENAMPKSPTINRIQQYKSTEELSEKISQLTKTTAI